MAHTVRITQDVTEICYFGDVTAAGRSLAMDDAAAALVSSGGNRLLIDCTRATIIEPRLGGHLESIDRAMTHPVHETCRVALVDLSSQFGLQATESEGFMRKFEVRAFRDRDEAVRWLMGR